MSSSVSMWLGISFVILGVLAVLLQAWLWNPKYWDALAKKSHAPPFWMGVHRAVGYAYAALYLVMMTEMVPRLWEYQVELPARTVVHATAAIAIGVILATKITILRFFRHFEESMPALGLMLLVCTIVLATWSLPFALRAHGSEAAFAEENRARVETILSRLELRNEDGSSRTARELAGIDGLYRGREVVMQRCAACHDLRTVLSEPRTGAGWLSLNRRMQDKPTLGRPLSDDEVLFATAYLIAITPQLQDDVRLRREEELLRAEAEGGVDTQTGASGEEAAIDDSATGETAPEDVAEADAGSVEGADAGVAVIEPSVPDAGRRPRRRRDAGVGRAPDAGTLTSAPTLTPITLPSMRPDAGTPAEPERLVYSAGLAREILNRRCIDCHGMEDVEAHGGDDRAGWSLVLRRMIRRGAELTSEEARVLAQYLAHEYPLAP